MIKILKEIFINILIGILIGFVLIFVGMFLPSIKSYYEYVDLDNNKGIAERCFYESHSGFGGGQGSPIFRLEDGTIKLVKEYMLEVQTECVDFWENYVKKGEIPKNRVTF